VSDSISISVYKRDEKGFQENIFAKKKSSKSYIANPMFLCF
jgi:hypothetical protein